MEKKYVEAPTSAEQESFTFPSEKGIVSVPLGFQPMGISIRGNTLAIADYFDPSVVLAEVSMTEDGVPQFSDIRSIRSTLSGGKRVRMFPDIFEPSGANRMQAVIMYSPTRLGLTRNGDRQIFDIILRADGEWEHEPTPSHLRSGGVDAITSAVLTDDGLVAIEIANGSICTVRDYRGFELKETPTVPHRYGIAVRKSDGAFITVADYRAEKRGLFIGEECRIPELYGNGIALLRDGELGAFVTRYGHAYPGSLGRTPGALIYVPPDYLKQR